MADGYQPTEVSRTAAGRNQSDVNRPKFGGRPVGGVTEVRPTSKVAFFGTVIIRLDAARRDRARAAVIDGPSSGAVSVVSHGLAPSGAKSFRGVNRATRTAALGVATGALRSWGGAAPRALKGSPTAGGRR